MGATNQSPPAPLSPPTKRRGDKPFPQVIENSRASASVAGRRRTEPCALGWWS